MGGGGRGVESVGVVWMLYRENEGRLFVVDEGCVDLEGG